MIILFTKRQINASSFWKNVIDKNALKVFLISLDHINKKNRLNIILTLNLVTRYIQVCLLAFFKFIWAEPGKQLLRHKDLLYLQTQ